MFRLPTHYIGTLLLMLVFAAIAIRPISIQAAPTATSIDFTGFTGAGFASTPAAGQLDSDVFAIEGFSGVADSSFGDTVTTDDAARGSSSGGVGTGGIYAFDVSNGGTADIALGVQPGGSDFTPGALYIRTTNDSGATVTSVNVQYDVYIYNDQGRGQTFDLRYDVGCGNTPALANFTSIPSSSGTTPAAADGSPAWVATNFNLTIDLTGDPLANDANFCLAFFSNDDTGSGARDEIALDNITIANLTPTAVELESFSATANSDGTVTVEWETSQEVDHAGFNILRRAANNRGAWTQVNEQLIASTGTNAQGAVYAFTDTSVAVGTWEYLLEDVETDGDRFQHVDFIATVTTQIPTAISLADQTTSSSYSLLIALFALVVVSGIVVTSKR